MISTKNFRRMNSMTFVNSRLMISAALAIWFVIVTGFSAFARSPVMVETVGILTVNVKCTGQGQVDADHRLTVSVANAAGTLTNVTVDIQKSTTASAIALQLKEGLVSDGVAATGPVANDTYPEDTAYDVKLPEGYKLKKIRIEKKNSSGGWGDRDGHLQVHNNQNVKTNSQAQPPVIPVPGFSSLYFHELQWYGQVKLIEFTIRGVNANGTSFEYSHVFTYDGQYPLPVFDHVGRFLQRRGMTVSYPSPTEMQVDVTSSTLNVYQADLVIYADASVNPQQLWTSEVEFTAQ
jgi:hypothetical protein